MSLTPQVLLLDEPTSSLDLTTGHWLIGLISELRKAGKTIITTTHDISLVKQISSRVIVLGEDHSMIADGTPPEVIADHKLLHRANIIHEHETDTFGYTRKPEDPINGKKIISFPISSSHKND